MFESCICSIDDRHAQLLVPEPCSFKSNVSRQKINGVKKHDNGAYYFPEGVKLDEACNVNGGEHYGVLAVEVISFN